jgi:hypothetical protein
MAPEGPPAEPTKYPNNPNKLSPEPTLPHLPPNTPHDEQSETPPGCNGCITIPFVVRWLRERF